MNVIISTTISTKHLHSFGVPMSPCPHYQKNHLIYNNICRIQYQSSVDDNKSLAAKRFWAISNYLDAVVNLRLRWEVPHLPFQAVFSSHCKQTDSTNSLQLEIDSIYIASTIYWFLNPLSCHAKHSRCCLLDHAIPRSLCIPQCWLHSSG